MAEINQNEGGLTSEDAAFFEQYQGAVPGQSLTNSKDQKYAWEQAPKFNNRREAELFILTELTEKEKFIAITDIIGSGTPLDVVARTYLFSGYSRGLWDVDLLMLLIEPTAYILMALAEKVEIDYELYEGDDAEDLDGDNPDNTLDKMNEARDVVQKGIKKISMKNIKVPQGISTTIKKELEELPVELIEEVKERTDTPSLLEAQ